MRSATLAAVAAALLLSGCSGGAAPPFAAELGGEDSGTGPDGDADVDADGDTDTDGTDPDAGPDDPGAPLYDAVGVYETTIAANGDPVDVYYPVPADGEGERFPVALLLQGADVGRGHYAGFAGRVAAYGFIVVVPDHQSPGFAGPGLYAEQSEAAEALAHMAAEDANPASPVAGAVDAERLVLLGHSYGGLCGLNVLRGVCEPPTCIGLSFERPEQLVGAAFYGTNAALPFVGSVILAIQNDGIPAAFVQGTLDGKALPEDTQEAYGLVQDPPKAYVGVIGANHYGICDANDPEGAQADPNPPALDQGIAVETIARWSALFLRAFALGDAAALEYVTVVGGPADPNANVVVEQ
jgi:dienelactone hydrolase